MHINRVRKLSECVLMNYFYRDISSVIILSGESTIDNGRFSLQSPITLDLGNQANINLPPIIFGKHKKHKTKSLFPKLGGMGSIGNANISHYSSMCQNRVALETTLRDKIRTGEEAKLRQFEIANTSRSIESSDLIPKQLNQISTARRGNNNTIQYQSEVGLRK
jgi:hypothetical protein